MKRQLTLTKDGSHTLAIPELNVTYHSIHGAIQESKHVFIHAGLHDVLEKLQLSSIQIFEMGFGTGLNAFLTALEAEKHNLQVAYTAVELYPLSTEETKLLNYPALLGYSALFQALHNSPWNEVVNIRPQFHLHKQNIDFTASGHSFEHNRFHLIYFDAFAPAAQPHLWTEAVFKKLYNMLLPGGVLVTYCSKGDVRRAMQAAGFVIKKFPGPPGKREMVRAEKKAG